MTTPQDDYAKKLLADITVQPLPLAFVKHLTPEARAAFHALFTSGQIAPLSSADNCYHAAPSAAPTAPAQPSESAAQDVTVQPHPSIEGAFMAAKGALAAPAPSAARTKRPPLTAPQMKLGVYMAAHNLCIIARDGHMWIANSEGKNEPTVNRLHYRVVDAFVKNAMAARYLERKDLIRGFRYDLTELGRAALS